jgi:histidyl-tRNA synthetase
MRLQQLAPAAGQADVYVVLAGAAAEAVGLELAEHLRNAAPALRIETNCGGGSFKSQLKRADRSGARFAVIVGDDEAGRRVAAVKPLRGDSTQRDVSFDELGSELRKAFETTTA